MIAPSNPPTASHFVEQIKSKLRPRTAMTVPEFCAAIQWQRPPIDVGLALRELVKSGDAEYAPLMTGQTQVPAFRKAGAA